MGREEGDEETRKDCLVDSDYYISNFGRISNIACLLMHDLTQEYPQYLPPKPTRPGNTDPAGDLIFA